MYVLYFLIAIITTTIGAITGVGGGVIIKPVLDIFAHYNSQTIAVLSSVILFSMAIVSIIKQVLNKSEFNIKIIIPLAFGSIGGGFIGQSLLNIFIANIESQSIIVLSQNIILAILIALIFFYTINKDKIASKNIGGIIPSIIVGIFLGMISSFLAIGGGPLNVGIFMYLFSYNLKTAAISSIFIILFTQLSKLSLILFTTGFEVYDLSVAPTMIIGAITGGFVGSKLSLSFSNNQIIYTFNGVQILVFLICVVNVVLQLI